MVNYTHDNEFIKSSAESTAVHGEIKIFMMVHSYSLMLMIVSMDWNDEQPIVKLNRNMSIQCAWSKIYSHDQLAHWSADS